MADGLLNKASIILTPTGYKAGTLYNVAPIDEPYEDFDFARTSTATRINSSGLVSNVATGVPRISYDSNGDNGHILLEPQRTNEITQNNQFDTTWIATNLDLTSGQNGIYNTTDAWLLNATDTLANVTISVSTTGESTYSVYAKAGSEDGIFIRFDGGGNPRAFFNLTNGTLINETNTTNTNVDDVGNGWYRCSITGSATITSARIYVADSSGSFVSSGNIYVQYAQLENGSYPTSIIPTYGSTETRATETATGAGSADLINSTEGVLYAEIASLTSDVDSEARIVLAASGDTNNSLRLYYNTTQDTIEYKCRVSSSNVCDITYDLGDSTQFHKIACKWKQNDFALWVDGVEVGTDSSGSTFSADTLNVLNFSNATTLSDFFYGKCKALAVFNEALSDSELTQLTT